ncbi:hypothetical protein [Antrihabitans sp. YC2-6]|uniref:hypothetical protein n=1 Tax=Antrihabitans sp. YC2-6 TaxID=2799498 RepID=UPI0018F35CFB|nr:hypothetical protein [Antrihabitans sp. YC2-6]MBJ8345695.1 hypothetical protein [Antrihabitans sp. YC2-6]
MTDNVSAPEAATTGEKADLLLTALVEYWRQQLTGPALDVLLEREVDDALDTADRLTLNQVVTPEQITTTAQKYATQWRIEGSIPELAGEIARRLYAHSAHDREPLRLLLDQRQFEEFTASLAGLPAFGRLIDRLYASPLTTSWASWFVHRIATDVVADNRRVAEKVPGVTEVINVGAQILGKIAPNAGREADLRLQELSERIVRYVQAKTRTAQPLDDTGVFVDAAADLWREHENDPISSFGDLLSTDDIEDLMVLAFEFFFTFRTTDYFRELLAEGVGYFFEKYGEATLAELLEDIGVGRADILEEARRFAPSILQLVLDNGMFEDWIRRTHADFFNSPAVHTILA